MIAAQPIRRLLIVSPHFPPGNAPDMQRVRMSLPHFVTAGWDVTVLTVADPTPIAPLEPELLATVPAAVRVVRAHCCSRRWTRWLGVNNVALRALPFLFRTGCRLLASRRYDVVYFSTTMFIVLPFGRIWRRLYGVPYVIDWQDPWVTDFYSQPGAPRPPGGWKYRIANRLARLLERWSLRHTSHLITVSAAYGESLRSRYPELRSLPCTELPFGSPDLDLQHLRTTFPRRTPLLPRGRFRLVFAGALGPGMLMTLEVLFAALARHRNAGKTFSVHFYGTTYSHRMKGPSTTLALAEKYGLQDLVHEQPERLPYFQALQVTLEADVNLLLGSSDLAFSPSKSATLFGAGRPILAIAHAESSLAAKLAGIGLPCALIEGREVTSAAIEATLARLQAIEQSDVPSVPGAHASRAIAARQLEIFSSVAHSQS